MSELRATLAAPPTIEIETQSGRVWVCRRLGRHQLAALGLLHLALGVARDEAGRAAELLHVDLPPEMREQMASAAREGLEADKPPSKVEPWHEAMARYDRMAAAVVEGVRMQKGSPIASVCLVLTQEEEHDENGVEFVWVGHASLVADVATIGTAVELMLVEEVQSGRRFRLTSHLRAVAG